MGHNLVYPMWQNGSKLNILWWMQRGGTEPHSPHDQLGLSSQVQPETAIGFLPMHRCVCVISVTPFHKHAYQFAQYAMTPTDIHIPVIHTTDDMNNIKCVQPGAVTPLTHTHTPFECVHVYANGEALVWPVTVTRHWCTPPVTFNPRTPFKCVCIRTGGRHWHARCNNQLMLTCNCAHNGKSTEFLICSFLVAHTHKHPDTVLDLRPEVVELHNYAFKVLNMAKDILMKAINDHPVKKQISLLWMHHWCFEKGCTSELHTVCKKSGREILSMSPAGLAFTYCLLWYNAIRQKRNTFWDRKNGNLCLA